MIGIMAQKRDVLGRKVKKLRLAGKLPAVLYGAGNRSMPITVELREFERVFREAGETSIIDLKIDGDCNKNVIIHDVAFDPGHDKPVHVDFFEVSADKPIKAAVSLEFIGESDAVKLENGVLVKVLHEIEIEALPKDLPHDIKVDVTLLKTFDDHILASDISLPAGVRFVGGDSAALIAKVDKPRIVGEAEPAEAPEEDISKIEVAEKGKEKEEEIEQKSSEDGSSSRSE